MNYRIRRAIERYIQVHGQQDTRDVIALFAKRFNTTKQRISGNISCMKCREQSHSKQTTQHYVLIRTNTGQQVILLVIFYARSNRFLI